MSAGIDCVRAPLDKLNPCWDATTNVLVSIGFTLMSHYETYICNEGRKIAEFMDEYGLECLKESALPILQCFDPVIKNYKYTGFGMTVNDCKLIHGLKSCLVKSMAAPKCSKPVELIETSYKKYTDESLCAGH